MGRADLRIGRWRDRFRSWQDGRIRGWRTMGRLSLVIDTLVIQSPLPPVVSLATFASGVPLFLATVGSEIHRSMPRRVCEGSPSEQRGAFDGLEEIPHRQSCLHVGLE